VSSQQLVSGQRPRAYRLFVPPGYDGHLRLPLVLDLHGSGGTSAGQAKTSGLETLSASERFIVATLEAEGGRWNVPVQDDRPDDVAYVRDVIAHVAARVCTDQTRVYATGFSGGGRMSSLLGCALVSRLAAIAPVSALRFPPAAGVVPVLVPWTR
jgi:polyhydroxybutyrate depolymerase